MVAGWPTHLPDPFIRLLPVSENIFSQRTKKPPIGTGETSAEGTVEEGLIEDLAVNIELLLRKGRIAGSNRSAAAIACEVLEDLPRKFCLTLDPIHDLHSRMGRFAGGIEEPGKTAGFAGEAVRVTLPDTS
jgi:hypothetical protein